MEEKNSNTNGLLTLNKGDAYKIKVEEPKDMGKSLFHPVYQSAIAAFKEIYLDNDKYRTERPNLKKQNVDRLPEFNNVIAFCGERGSGKTSAMVSFRNLLDKWSDDNVIKESISLELKGAGFSNETRFVCLDTVDPSRFEPHDRLIGSIVGELFRRFERILDELGEKRDLDKQRKVEAAFKDVLIGVQMLSNSEAQPFGTPGAGENTFDILKRAGKAASMRDLIFALVEAFLDFIPGPDKGIKYLVIPVDDLDMSVQHAYVLAEDIRKYFLIPNVVILLAAKLDQLRMAVEQSYVERFKQYLKLLNRPLKEDIETMSNLYLEKLVPLGRRLNMPDFSRIEVTRDIELVWENKNVGSLESFVFERIFRKTGIVFVEREDQVHPIVPTTLRELHNFLEWTAFIGGESSGTYDEGLSQFRKYFILEWVPRNLERSDEEIVSKIEGAPLAQKNWTIIQLIARRLHLNIDVENPDFDKIEKSRDWWETTFEREWKEIDRITDRDAAKHDISIGDVRLMLGMMERLSGLVGGGKLVFAIKTILSIELLTSFDAAQQENFRSEFREDRICNLINGSFVHPLMYLMSQPENFRTLLDAAALKRSQSALRLTQKIDLGTSTKSRSVIERFADIVNEVAGERGEVFARRLFFISTQNAYLGDIAAALLEKHKADVKWYDAALPIFGGGRRADHISFDFWAFLFWAFVPTKAFERVGNGKSLLEETNQEIHKHLIGRYRFWRQNLQIEVLDWVGQWMQSRYKADQKNQKFTNHYTVSFFFDWSLKNFVYACKAFTDLHRTYLERPPIVFDLFEGESKPRIVERRKDNKTDPGRKYASELEALFAQNKIEGKVDINELMEIPTASPFVDWIAKIEKELKPDEEYLLVKKILQILDGEIIKVMQGNSAKVRQVESEMLKKHYETLTKYRTNPQKGDLVKKNVQELINDFQSRYVDLSWRKLEVILAAHKKNVNDTELRAELVNVALEVVEEVQEERRKLASNSASETKIGLFAVTPSEDDDGVGSTEETDKRIILERKPVSNDDKSISESEGYDV